MNLAKMYLAEGKMCDKSLVVYIIIVQVFKVCYTIHVVCNIPYKWDFADGEISVILHREN